MNATVLFNTLQTGCEHLFATEIVQQYCVPGNETLAKVETVLAGLETAGNWTCAFGSSVGTNWLWTWEKSGEYGGHVAQGAWLLISLMLARNVYYMAFGDKQTVVIKNSTLVPSDARKT